MFLVQLLRYIHLRFQVFNVGLYGGPLSGARPVPQKMEPFGPYKSDPYYVDNGLSLYTILPLNQKLPTKPTKDWFISNWWSVTVPGLPFIQGASSEHPEMLMSYILPRYPESQYEPSLIQHGKEGNSHFCLSWGVAYEDLGWSKERFGELCLLVNRFLPFSLLMIAGKSD